MCRIFKIIFRLLYSDYISWKMATFKDHGRVSGCQRSDTVSGDRWMCDASSVLFRCTSHDVQIKWRGSCAICGFASSFGFGMLRRSGSRGLRWNSLMRRRGDCKKKKSMRARDPVHRHTHVTFTRVPAFWCIGFWFPAELTRDRNLSFDYKSQNSLAF